MQNLINEIKGWIVEAGEKIKQSLVEDQLIVDTKTDRKDLVTNVDKMIQDYLIAKIMAFDSEAKILGEENDRNQLQDLSGRVFIIDPIDGTMNFVLEQEHFCIMVGVYEDGEGILGFVYDVMGNRFLWGGKEVGVFLNEEPITIPTNLTLSEGLLGMNGVMYGKNAYNTQIMGERSMGVRMSGCAGLELMDIALGKRIGYVSNLAPWDYAAGGVLLETLGMKMSNIYGEPLKFDGRERFIAGTPSAYEEMLALSLETK